MSDLLAPHIGLILVGAAILLFICLVVAGFLLYVTILSGGHIKLGWLNLKGPDRDRGRTRPDNSSDQPLTTQNKPHPPHDAPAARDNIDSPHAITTVVALITKGDRLVDATLREVGAFAESFYGVEAGTAEAHLISKSGKELMDLLKRFMDPQDFDELEKDQQKLLESYGQGYPMIAEIPVTFNYDHPYYSNDVFLPVVVSREKPKKLKNDLSEHPVHIIYLDLKHFEEPMERYRRSRERMTLC